MKQWWLINHNRKATGYSRISTVKVRLQRNKCIGASVVALLPLDLHLSSDLPRSTQTTTLNTTKRAKSPTMAPGDDSSDLSSLSSLSPAPSEDELGAISDVEDQPPKKGIQKYFSKVSEAPNKEPSPPPRKRSPSPPHEYVLADNPDIAVRGYSPVYALFVAFWPLCGVI